MLNSLVDLRVQVDEHDEGDDAQDDQTAPVEVGGVERRRAEVSGHEDGLVGAGDRLVGGRVDVVVVLHLGLEEPRRGEEDGQEGDGGDVLDDALRQRVRLVHGLAVVERVVDGDEALQGDRHSEEDGRRDGDLVERVQEVREQDNVQPAKIIKKK